MDVYSAAAREMAKEGNHRGAKEMVKMGATVDSVLIGAAIGGYLSTVKWAYKNGAGHGTPCETALRVAIENDHYNVASYLIKKGTNISHDCIKMAVKNGDELLLQSLESALRHNFYDMLYEVFDTFTTDELQQVKDNAESLGDLVLLEEVQKYEIAKEVYQENETIDDYDVADGR